MHRDVAFGGATLVLSVVYYGMAVSVPISQLADTIGPQGLPKAYALILAALSLILIARSIRDPRSRVRDLTFGIRDANRAGAARSRISDLGSPSFRAVAVLLIGVAYIMVAPWLGYLLSISLLILATTYCQGLSISRQSAILAFAGGVFFWLLFVMVMGIAQPPGFFPPQR